MIQVMLLEITQGKPLRLPGRRERGIPWSTSELPRVHASRVLSIPRSPNPTSRSSKNYAKDITQPRRDSTPHDESNAAHLDALCGIR
jgi:hypothetical protein